MRTRPPLAEQVVVITGASSGIGLETSRQFASRGARVVLAARGAEVLEQVAADIVHAGGTAVAVPTDVTDWDQVQALAAAAVEAFGRIDTWVNGAGVSAYGRVNDVTVEEFQQVIDIDLMGQVHGVKAALPYLLPQGSGAIIAISSGFGRRAVPLQAPYCAAKFGVVGFMESLRLELQHDRTGVTATTILPSSIDTPLFDNATSRLGVRPAPIPPIYKPAAVAEAIMFAAEHPVPEIVVGAGGKGLLVSQRLAPQLTDRVLLMGGQVFKRQRSNLPIEGEGNLFASGIANGSTTGSFGRAAPSRSMYTRHVEQHPNRKRALVAGALLAGVYAAHQQMRRTEELVAEAEPPRQRLIGSGR